MGVNNLPRVAARQCAGQELNLQPFDRESNVLLLHYRVTCAITKFNNSMLNSNEADWLKRINWLKSTATKYSHTKQNKMQ